MRKGPYVPIAKRKYYDIEQRVVHNAAARDTGKRRYRPQFTRMMRAFIEKYLTPGDAFMNGTQAAVCAGYTKKWAHRRANRILKHPLVREFIDEWLKQKGVSRDRILYEVCQLAYCDNFTEFFKARDKLAALMFLNKFAGPSGASGRNLAKLTGFQVSFGPQSDMRKQLDAETRRSQVPGIDDPGDAARTNVQIVQVDGAIPNLAGGNGGSNE